MGEMLERPCFNVRRDRLRGMLHGPDAVKRVRGCSLLAPAPRPRDRRSRLAHSPAFVPQAVKRCQCVGCRCTMCRRIGRRACVIGSSQASVRNGMEPSGETQSRACSWERAKRPPPLVYKL